MNDEFEYKFDLLKQEIDNLQNAIRTYDSNLFVVKGWAITVFSAFVFFAAEQKQPRYLGYCACVVLLFWLTDALFKRLQRAYIERYNNIEQFVQSEAFTKAVAERCFSRFSVPDTSSGFRVTTLAIDLPTILRAVFVLPTAWLYIAMLGLLALLRWA